MKKISKLTVRLVAVIEIFALSLLAACATVGSAMGNATDGASLTVCHATGNAANPYEEISVTSAELSTHLAQDPTDISPVPVNGCPTTAVVINNGRITICHATSSQTAPYDEITVSINGLEGHGTHEGDTFPTSTGGCPTTPAVTNTDKITICHATSSKKNPYTEITISVNGLNGHDKHKDDIIPAPAGGCPTTKP